jgi:hypothetical protein
MDEKAVIECIGTKAQLIRGYLLRWRYHLQYIQKMAWPLENGNIGYLLLS